MTRLLRSIAIRFPILLGAIVLAVALVIGQLAQREMGDILMRQATSALSDGAAQVATMLGNTTSTARRTLTEAGEAPVIRQMLAGSGDTAIASRLLEEALAARPDTTRIAVRVLSLDGRVRAVWPAQSAATSMGWTSVQIREGVLRSDSAIVGPIISVADTMPGFVALIPVRAEGGEQLGWMEEIHIARGVGAADVRALIDVERLLLGSRDWTVWSDFERVVPGPQLTEQLDSLQRVSSANGATALGLARQVPGTSWMVWVERPEAAVLAPTQNFLRRMWYAVIIIGLLGGAFAWMLGNYMGSRIRAVAAELDRTLTGRGAATSGEHSVLPSGSTDAKSELRLLEDSYAALETRVAKRRHLDEQLLQADKLEAVGRLAGGIAHDFNNLLTVMASYGEMVRMELPTGSVAAADMDEVLKATQRASALTRQLLAFSRQGVSDVRPLDINEVVQSTDRMLARLIPSNVERVIGLGKDLPPVRADHNQLEQVLINLIVNAVDAMPEGGRITIRSSLEEKRQLEWNDEAPSPAEDFVCLAVTDTGVGMDAATLARVFDPFFTTKAIGKGTGLGLATVHGIVRDSGGRVLPYSEPGQGTTMRVYLPIARDTESAPARPKLPIAERPLAGGTIVVAEDDAGTRLVITRILKSAGHTVRGFESADGALAWLDEQPVAEHPMAVITDVMMPGTNGIAFLTILRQRYPQLPVLLISGYADVSDRMPDDIRDRPVILEKPFAAAALHEALRRAVRSSSGREA